MARSISFGPGTPGEVYGKFFVIPQNPQDREFLLAVDNRTRADVRKRYGILLDYDWQANTIANCMFEVIVLQLSLLIREDRSKNGVGIALYELFNAVVSFKNNDRAEKEGNINVFFEPGKHVIDLIEKGPEDFSPENPVSAFEHFSTDDPNENKFIHNLDYQTRYDLMLRHNLTFPDHMIYAVLAIGYTFLENIFIELLYRLSNLESSEDDTSEKIVSVNFNDNVEIHGSLKNGEVSINMRPGMNSKLLIKSDELTEHTMGDE